MRRALWVVLIATACATTPATPAAAPANVPLPAPSQAPSCSKEAPAVTSDDATKWLGAKIEKVCLVSTGELKLEALVAPDEGQALTAELVSHSLRELVLPGTVRDASAIAQPLPSGGVVLTYVVSEYPLVGKISFEGVKTVSVDSLRELAQQTAYASPHALRRLTETMTGLFLRRGFSHATISPRPASPTAGKSDVAFVVEEGTRTTVDTIRFVGLKRLREPELRKLLRSTVNGPYLELQAEEDVALLSAPYLDKGMVTVNIKQATAPGKAPDTLELIFTIEEGDVFTMGKLELKGHPLGEEKAVLKALETKTGTVFSRAVLKRDIDRLTERAAKQGVKIGVTPITNVDSEKKRIDVVLEVEKLAGGPIQF